MIERSAPRSSRLQAAIKRSELVLYRAQEKWGYAFPDFFKRVYLAFAEDYRANTPLDEYIVTLDVRLPAEVFRVAFGTRWIHERLVEKTRITFDELRQTYQTAGLPWDDLTARVALILDTFHLEKEILELTIICEEAAHSQLLTKATLRDAAASRNQPPEQTQSATISPPPESSGHGSAGHDQQHPLTWKDIEIVFLDEHKVQVFERGKPQESENYAVMGFNDGRTDKPKRAWKILRELAEKDGTWEIPYRQNQEAKANPRADREAAQRDVFESRKYGFDEVAKRMQEIRRVLEQRWRIDDDPILFVQGTGYVAQFKIRCSSAYHR